MKISNDRDFKGNFILITATLKALKIPFEKTEKENSYDP